MTDLKKRRDAESLAFIPCPGDGFSGQTPIQDTGTPEKHQHSGVIPQMIMVLKNQSDRSDESRRTGYRDGQTGI